MPRFVGSESPFIGARYRFDEPPRINCESLSTEIFDERAGPREVREKSLKRGEKRKKKKKKGESIEGGSESSSLIRSVAAARVNFSRISRATRGRGEEHALRRGWKSENRSTKNCTPCRPRLNINYSPCSTANASLFVRIVRGEEARYNNAGCDYRGITGRFRSVRDIKKKRMGRES